MITNKYYKEIIIITEEIFFMFGFNRSQNC